MKLKTKIIYALIVIISYSIVSTMEYNDQVKMEEARKAND